MNCNLKCNRKLVWIAVLVAIGLTAASAQVLTADQVKKAAPTSFFFAGQNAAGQLRNTAGLKSSGGKLVLAGLVGTSGYATALAQEYQGFLVTEIKLTFEGAKLDPGSYSFGVTDGNCT